jgi:hypothetical protein
MATISNKCSSLVDYFDTRQLQDSYLLLYGASECEYCCWKLLRGLSALAVEQIRQSPWRYSNSRFAFACSCMSSKETGFPPGEVLLG